MVNYYRDMIDRLNKSYPGEFTWAFGVPSSHDYIEWAESEIAVDSSIRVVPILPVDRVDKPKIRDGFAGQPLGWFCPPAYQYFASNEYLRHDVVVSCLYHAHAVMRMQAEAFMDRTSRTPNNIVPPIAPPAVVNLLMETGADKDFSLLSTDIGKLCLLFGAAASDITVVLNDIDKKWLTAQARSLMAPSWIKWHDIQTISPPIDVAAIPHFDRPKDRVHFFHGSALYPKCNIPLLIRSIESAGALVDGVKFIVTTQKKQSSVPSDVTDSPFVQLHSRVARNEYRQLLELGDFLLCATNYEGTGIAYMEAILSGMTPIILDRPWIRARVPADYPFLCPTEKDFLNAVLYCAKNPKKAKGIGQRAVTHVRESYAANMDVESWYAVLTTAAARRHQHTAQLCRRHFLLELAKQVIAAGNVTTQELPNAIADISQNLDARRLKAILPYIRALLLGNGYTENLSGWRRT